MDKLQMTVTLSEPELLAYLRQFSGARERSFMLRMLAMRGLQSGRQSGTDGPLLPAMASSPVQRLSEPWPMPFANAPAVSKGKEPPAPAQLLAQPPVVSPTAAPAVSAGPFSMPPADATREASDAHMDPLAGLDIAALNDAMDRY